ncbi:MAG: hypothetical protein SF028_05210 [Candidatus Sumerlaeia bacterium]|nr:hypothetical protein [Candidatus Sumerlaeia bacterium]
MKVLLPVLAALALAGCATTALRAAPDRYTVADERFGAQVRIDPETRQLDAVYVEFTDPAFPAPAYRVVSGATPEGGAYVLLYAVREGADVR